MVAVSKYIGRCWQKLFNKNKEKAETEITEKGGTNRENSYHGHEYTEVSP